ncbi:Rix1 complex component [Microdochium trichocladiopsis]|uniref:Pre-rRNA-processing protein n=1 Tax=Microdochium trichocladiopsis TaxID=1682393 RepID=A0A9P8YDV7_9PEZI|nr:Rix1 complex component [Microdochium trichocladiopsis]KAH7037444.1 Rix1 complex component [Microdochium trichocladiopsis]
MGSSARKKKEKQKDFQKPKLKVGKAKPKANNFTDTSFKSKAIVLQQQLTDNAPTVVERFKHNFSLVGSRSDTHRRDALAYLTSQLSTNPPTNPVGTSALLHKVLPIMSDSSKSVRANLLKLLQCLPADQVRPHVERIILYIRGAMTNISQEVKDDGLSYMEWLLDTAGDDVVASAGCWVKPLNDFIAVLGWSIRPPPSTGPKSGWTQAPRTTFGAKKHGESFPRQMMVLAKFLEVGFRAESSPPWTPRDWLNGLSVVPRHPDPYGYIGLFKPARDEDSEMYKTKQDRLEVFNKKFREAIEVGVDLGRKEGGTAGRAAATLAATLLKGAGSGNTASRFDDDDEQHLWAGYIM